MLATFAVSAKTFLRRIVIGLIGEMGHSELRPAEPSPAGQPIAKVESLSSIDLATARIRPGLTGFPAVSIAPRIAFFIASHCSRAGDFFVAVSRGCIADGVEFPLQIDCSLFGAPLSRREWTAPLLGDTKREAPGTRVARRSQAFICDCPACPGG